MNEQAHILLVDDEDAVTRTLTPFLERSGDDYINKPFDPHELVARMRAVLRRAQPGERPLAAAQKLTSGELVLDRRMHRAWVSGKDAGLTPKAVSLLDYLMTHPDELVTRDRLLDAVWGWEYLAGTRTVDSRIAELRRALGDDASQPRFIETVPGQGYRFVAHVVGSET